jgi:hypothetical protein
MILQQNADRFPAHPRNQFAFYRRWPGRGFSYNADSNPSSS